MQLKTKESCAMESKRRPIVPVLLCAERVSRFADGGCFRYSRVAGKVLLESHHICPKNFLIPETFARAIASPLDSRSSRSTTCTNFHEVLRGHKLPKIDRVPHTWMRDLPKSIRVSVHERRTDQK